MRAQLRLIDLTDKAFGRLHVICREENRGRQTMWRCRCDCGNEVTVAAAHLRNGHTKSCGCLLSEFASNTFSTHRQTNTALYRMWYNMKTRCSYKKSDRYSSYGGRGIYVCDEWKASFEAFMQWALEHGYKNGLSIERKDVNKGYYPENCEFIPIKLQHYNKRTNHYLEYDGKRLTVSEWSDITKIPYQTLLRRINKLGWPAEKALTTPVREKRC